MAVRPAAYEFSFRERPFRRTRSPLAPPLSPTSKLKCRLVDGHRWRYTHQAAPHTSVKGFETLKSGITQYIIETRFGDGPPVQTRHRFSDFLQLHATIGKGHFPVEKAFLQTGAVKEARVERLGKYLEECVEQCVEAWATDKDAQGDVLSRPLQDFLNAEEIDRARLESMRLDDFALE